jgi:hypothetical protein
MAFAKPVIWLVVHRVPPTLAIGVVAGAALSWMAGASIRGLLYKVQPLDPMTKGMAILLSITIGIGGAAVPAFQAMRVDPSAALRQD